MGEAGRSAEEGAQAREREEKEASKERCCWLLLAGAASGQLLPAAGAPAAQGTHRVLSGAKDELWGPVVAGANVGHGGLAGQQRLCAAKVAQL